MKMTGYIIVLAESAAKLEEKLHGLVGEGWQPVGGVAYSGEAPKPYMQAVVFYGE